MLFFACTSAEKDTTPSIVDDSSVQESTPPPTDDTAPEAVVAFQNIQVSQGGIATVLLISWETSRAGLAWIEWSETGDPTPFAHQTRASTVAVTGHDFVLAGLPPDGTGNWRLVHEEEGVRSYSDPVDFTVSGRSNLPTLQVLQASDAVDGYFLMPVESAGSVAVFDRKGRAVWWWDSEVSGFLARGRYENGSIWYNQFNKDPHIDSYVVAVSESANSSITYPVPGNHHDFWVDAEGMALITQDPKIGPDGEIWTGDQLIWQPWGRPQEQLWTSWDHVTQSGGTGENFFPGTTDWMHCNGIDREGEIFVMSCKGQDAVYAIGLDQSTPWTFNGQDGTLTQTGPTLNLIHGPTLDGQNLWIFSNSILEGRQGPEILEYTLSADFSQADLTNRYEIPDLQALHFGNMVLAENGNRVVSFGWGGQLVELSPTMELISSYYMPFSGTYFDYVSHLGGPVAEPY